MFQRQIKITDDGSKTFYWPEKNEHFHSTHGAMQESRHIFIEHGFCVKSNESKNLKILELGYGTGLNALLSFQKANELGITIYYNGIEKFPINSNENQLLNYKEIAGDAAVFDEMFDACWEVETKINSKHILLKTRADMLSIDPPKNFFDLIYFDAFAPDIQPELWNEFFFQRLFFSLKPGGFFLTYSAKGIIKRALKSVGFHVELIPGPPGKREFIRAAKPKTE